MPSLARAQQKSAPRPLREQQSTIALRDRLLALSPTIRRDEAERVALRSHETSRQLAREYQVVGPAQFHNFLVNAGFRKRGLCHHWTRDLIGRLRALKLTTIDLHWAGARAGTLREHNAVVVTAKGQSFASGVVLDAWRKSGRLFFGSVATDRYPWKEDLTDCFCARRARSPTLLKAEHQLRRQHRAAGKVQETSGLRRLHAKFI
jgi:hypothetical protein